uniref:Uncharacterized protein n=1 Tax=Anguilla anguilla TaxID=7936 RepID=A0A0E9SE26_ANGAN
MSHAGGAYAGQLHLPSNQQALWVNG